MQFQAREQGVNTEPLSDAKIIESWHTNADAWTDAVRAGAIASRKLCTDRAIVDAVAACAPRSVVDIGCGEGWLVRALAARGIPALGVDAIPALVEQARAGGGDFERLSYAELGAGRLARSFDVVVCNFSLLGEQSVLDVFAALPALLNRGGHCIVQTLHPLLACGEQPYMDGWRSGSWDGFGSAFTDPAPWYFRTLESWVRLFDRHGLRLRELREPLHPATGKPASVLFTAAWPAA
jgi:2-polyprenyl-3-methyl-5-hydroxy-6-metoxy-1,4-benzoquinol methylase